MAFYRAHMNKRRKKTEPLFRSNQRQTSTGSQEVAVRGISMQQLTFQRFSTAVVCALLSGYGTQ